MTRQADPKSTGYFSVKARNEDEQKLIGDLKLLACQNGSELADLVFEEIQHMLKAHNWLHKNPQPQPLVFQQEKPSAIIENCKCQRPAVVYATDLRGMTKVDYYFCQYCFNNVYGNDNPKIWKINIDKRSKK